MSEMEQIFGASEMMRMCLNALPRMKKVKEVFPCVRSNFQNSAIAICVFAGICLERKSINLSYHLFNRVSAYR